MFHATLAVIHTSEINNSRMVLGPGPTSGSSAKARRRTSGEALATNLETEGLSPPAFCFMPGGAASSRAPPLHQEVSRARAQAEKTKWPVGNRTELPKY